MTKKEQAFELFTQGKRLGDPELEALGVKPETSKRYFIDWLKSRKAARQAARELEAVKVLEEPESLEIILEPTQGAVPISSLRAGQEFEFSGNRYRINSNRTIALLEWAPSGKFRIERQTGGISPDTLVNLV